MQSLGGNQATTNTIILFTLIVKRADWLVKEGTTQNVATISLASSKVGIKLPMLFETHSEWLVNDGNTQEVNTCLAFAKLNIKSSLFFSEAEKQVEWLMRHDNTQGIANTAWSFAKLRIKSLPLFNEIEEQQSDWFVNKGSNAWAFAKLDIKSSSKFFASIDDRAEWLIENGETQHMQRL